MRSNSPKFSYNKISNYKKGDDSGTPATPREVQPSAVHGDRASNDNYRALSLY